MKIRIYNLPNINPGAETRRGWHTSKTATKRDRFLCPQNPPRTPLSFTVLLREQLVQVLIK